MNLSSPPDREFIIPPGREFLLEGIYSTIYEFIIPSGQGIYHPLRVGNLSSPPGRESIIPSGQRSYHPLRARNFSSRQGLQGEAGIYPSLNDKLIEGRINPRLPWRPRRVEKFIEGMRNSLPGGEKKFIEGRRHYQNEKIPPPLEAPEGGKIPCPEGSRNS